MASLWNYQETQRIERGKEEGEKRGREKRQKKEKEKNEKIKIVKCWLLLFFLHRDISNCSYRVT